MRGGMSAAGVCENSARMSEKVQKGMRRNRRIRVLEWQERVILKPGAKDSRIRSIGNLREERMGYGQEGASVGIGGRLVEIRGFVQRIELGGIRRNPFSRQLGTHGH